VRHSTVKFDSRDFFIVAGNPNDSGNVSYSSTSPVVGLLYELTPELAWRYAPLGFSTALEGRYSSKVYVDDANTAAADSYTTLGLRAGFEQQVGRLRFTEFVRLDNVTDANYIGSVIVNEANQRFYEPSPTRNWFAGVTVGYTF
jgi:iron complex outermembrane receptor protein